LITGKEFHRYRAVVKHESVRRKLGFYGCKRKGARDKMRTGKKFAQLLYMRSSETIFRALGAASERHPAVRNAGIGIQ